MEPGSLPEPVGEAFLGTQSRLLEKALPQLPTCAQELETPSEQLQSHGHLEVSSPRACMNFPCVCVRKTLPPPRTWSSLKPDAPAFLPVPVSFKLAAP